MKKALSALVPAVAAAALALTASPASAAVSAQPVNYHGCKFWGEGHPGIRSFKVYVRQDSCGRSQGDGMRAYAYCVTVSGLNRFDYGPAVYKAGEFSDAGTCPDDTIFLGTWGYQYEVWPWGQPHHHRIVRDYQMGSARGFGRT